MENHKYHKIKEIFRHDIVTYSKKSAEHMFKYNIKEVLYVVDEETNRIAICHNMGDVDEFYNNSELGMKLKDDPIRTRDEIEKEIQKLKDERKKLFLELLNIYKIKPYIAVIGTSKFTTQILQLRWVLMTYPVIK